MESIVAPVGESERVRARGRRGLLFRWSANHRTMSADDEFDDPLGQPSLDIGTLVSNGLDGLLSTTGAQLTALMATFAIVSSVLTETLAVTVVRDGLSYVRENYDMSEPEAQEALEEIERGIGDMGFGLDVPIPVILAGLLVLALLTEAVMIAAARAFANNELDGVPIDLARRRL